jgi:hypothetical protein
MRDLAFIYRIEMWASKLFLSDPLSSILRGVNRSLEGGPVVVHASAAKCLLQGPFCISLLTGVIE